MCCRSKVLELNGMRLSDFSTHKEALKVADELVATNKKEMGHDQPDIEHTNPLLTKVFYVHGQGKKRTWAQVEKKDFKAEADIKSQKQVLDASVFIEGFGAGSVASSSGGQGVKVENVVYGRMCAQKDSLRQHLQAHTQTHTTSQLPLT